MLLSPADPWNLLPVPSKQRMRDFLVGKIWGLGSSFSSSFSSCLRPRLACVLWLLRGLWLMLSFLGGRLGRSGLVLRLLLLLVLCGTRGLYTRGRESERLPESEASWRSTDNPSRSRRRPRGQRCSASICGDCRRVFMSFLPGLDVYCVSG